MTKRTIYRQKGKIILIKKEESENLLLQREIKELLTKIKDNTSKVG